MAPLSIRSSNALAASAKEDGARDVVVGEIRQRDLLHGAEPRSTSSDCSKFSRTASSQPSVTPRSTPKRKRRPAGSAAS